MNRLKMFFRPKNFILVGTVFLSFLLLGAGTSIADPLPAPENVTAKPVSAASARVIISGSEVSGASSYNIYWSKKQGVTTSQFDGQLMGRNSLTSSEFVVRHLGEGWNISLTHDTTYYYIVTAVNDAQEDGVPSVEVQATIPPLNVYLMKNGDLFGTTMGGDLNFDGHFQFIDANNWTGDAGDWTGDLEVTGDRVYLMKDGNLYGTTIENFNMGGPLKEIDQGGWTGDLEAAGDRVYLMKNGNIYSTLIENFKMRKPLQIFYSGEDWTGDFEFSGIAIGDMSLFLMKNGNLYVWNPDWHSDSDSHLKEIGTGGWTGDLEVVGSRLYVTKNWNLYGTTVGDDAELTGPLQEIDRGGWTGDFENGCN